jgi:hypothetical protein
MFTKRRSLTGLNVGTAANTCITQHLLLEGIHAEGSEPSRLHIRSGKRGRGSEFPIILLKLHEEKGGNGGGGGWTGDNGYSVQTLQNPAKYYICAVQGAGWPRPCKKDSFSTRLFFKVRHK